MWKLNIISSNMYRNSIITFVIIILAHERRAFGLLMNESVCFINEQSNNRNDTWCITELKLCGNAPAYDMSVNIKQFLSSRNKCVQQCLNQSTVSLENYTSEVPVKCSGKSNCSLADISVPSILYGGILTLTFVCNNTDDGVEADNSTTTKTGNTLLPTSSSVTSISIHLPTTNNSTRTTESSIFSTGNNTITAGTAQFSTDSGDSYTVIIVVSVVVPIIIVVVVVAVLMYKRNIHNIFWCMHTIFWWTEISINSWDISQPMPPALCRQRCAFGSPKNISVCFGKEPSQNNDSWCQQYLILCDASVAYNISVYMRSFPNSGNSYSCRNCKSQSTDPPNNFYPNFPSTCNGKSNCSLADISVPSTDHGGILTLTYVCNKTDSLAAAIAVSVVIPAIIALVVAAVMMYRRGKCKLRLVKCMKMYDKHTDTADAYDMSSRGNVNLTNDLSRGVDVNVCDVDYCEIDKVGKETDVEYSHVNLEKKLAVQDPTYNHILHFNNSSGNAKQTYNHVGDVTLRITESSSLQPGTYSHIGAMAKPASEQLTDDSYAHINRVMKYTPEANDINPYECAVLETNCGPTGIFGHQECKMNFGKEKKFYVVIPSKADVNNEDPVSHSYFILEKHEKEA